MSTQYSQFFVIFYTLKRRRNILNFQQFGTLRSSYTKRLIRLKWFIWFYVKVSRFFLFIRVSYPLNLLDFSHSFRFAFSVYLLTLFEQNFWYFVAFFLKFFMFSLLYFNIPVCNLFFSYLFLFHLLLLFLRINFFLYLFLHNGGSKNS